MYKDFGFLLSLVRLHDTRGGSFKVASVTEKLRSGIPAIQAVMLTEDRHIMKGDLRSIVNGIICIY